MQLIAKRIHRISNVGTHQSPRINVNMEKIILSAQLICVKRIQLGNTAPKPGVTKKLTRAKTGVLSQPSRKTVNGTVFALTLNVKNLR